MNLPTFARQLGTVMEKDVSNLLFGMNAFVRNPPVLNKIKFSTQ